MDAVDAYIAEIGKHPLLSPEEEYQLAIAVESGCATSRTKLICCNLRLVVSVATDYEAMTSDRFLDLVTVGNIGLMKAIDRFKPKLGNKLSTYAVWWIKQAIREEHQKNHRTIRISASTQKKISAAKTAARKDPTDQAKQKIVENLERALPSTVSLDAPYLGDRTIKDMYADPNTGESENIAEEALVSQLFEFLRKLQPRERDIIERRFGLNGYEESSLDRIGKHYGLTRERVRQLQKVGMTRLRSLFNCHEITLTERDRDLLDLVTETEEPLEA